MEYYEKQYYTDVMILLHLNQNKSNRPQGVKEEYIKVQRNISLKFKIKQYNFLYGILLNFCKVLFRQHTINTFVLGY